MKKKAKPHIVVRESVFLLIIRIVFLELLFLGLSAIVTYILNNPSIPIAMEEQLFAVRFLVMGALFVTKIALYVYIALQWANTSYELNQGSIIYRTGILSQKKRTYKGNSIETVTLKQGILGRIINFGSVELYSPYLKKRIFISNIPRPRMFVEAVGTMLNPKANANVVFQER